MTDEHPRIKRERITIKAMVKIYCKNNHKLKSDICNDCQTLLDYANLRLLNCPYQQNKPTCKNCSTHCYKEPEKSKIRKIMKYSGPRIMFTHPILALRHIIDGMKKNKKKN